MDLNRVESSYLEKNLEFLKFYKNLFVKLQNLLQKYRDSRTNEIKKPSTDNFDNCHPSGRPRGSIILANWWDPRGKSLHNRTEHRYPDNNIIWNRNSSLLAYK